MASQTRSNISATDDLGIHYASKAAGSNAKAQEAAMNVVLGEDYINEGQSYTDALKCANKALKIYREIGSSVHEADCLRLIIHAYRMKSEMLRQDHPRDVKKLKEADKTLEDADKIAAQEGESFRKKGDVRGQAAMLLASAEVNFQGQGDSKRKKALGALAEARQLSKEVGDKKMEATAVHLLGHINLSLHKVETGVQYAFEALSLFRGTSDVIGEAKALRTISEGRRAQGLGEDAIVASKQAVSIWRELGKKKQEAFELHELGTIYLAAGEADLALECGQTCQELFKELKYGKGWAAASVSMVIQAHIGKGDAAAAVTAAEEALNEFRADGEQKDVILALKSLSNAQEANGDLQGALKTAEQELQECRELGDQQWEPHSIHHVALLQSAIGKSKEAGQTAMQAYQMFRKIDNKHGEAHAIFTVAQEHLKAGDAMGAFKATRDAQSIFRKNDQKEMEGALLFVQAQAQLMLGNEEEAMAAAKEAEVYLHQVKDYQNEAGALRIVADIHRVNDEYEEAAKEGVKAQARLRDSGDKENEVDTIRWLSDLHSQFKKTKPALRTAKEMLRAVKGMESKVQVETYILVAEKTLAHLKAEAEGHKEGTKLIEAKAPLALKPSKEALSIAKKSEDKLLICKALVSLGTSCMELSLPKDALEVAEELTTVSTDLTDKPTEAATLILSAEARAATGRMDLAGELATKAFKVAQEINNKDIMERCKKFVAPMMPGMGMGGGKRMGTRIEKRKVKKWVKKGGGGGGGKSLAIQKDASDMMVMSVLKSVSTEVDENVGLDTPLMDSGVDSLSAISLRNDLQKASGLNLPGTLMFDMPTAGAISAFIVEQSASAAESAGGGADDGPEEWEEIEVEEDVEVPYEIDDGMGGGVRYEMRKVKKWVKKGKKAGGGGGGKAVVTKEQASMQVVSILKSVATDIEGDIALDAPIMDLGVDSLAAIEVRNGLQKASGANLPGTLMFDFPTAGAMGEFIAQTIADSSDGGGGGDDDGEDEWEEIEVEEQVAVPIEGGYYPPLPAVGMAPSAPAAASASAAVVAAPEKKGMPREQVAPLVLSSMQEMAAEAGVDPELDTPLMDAGMDSLAAINFRNDLVKATGLKLPGTIMFDMPTGNALVDYIVTASMDE